MAVNVVSDITSDNTEPGHPPRLSVLDPHSVQIAGLQPLSTIDWPGKLAAVLFLQGCPYRCPYCHNFEILDPRTPGQVSWQEVLDLLAKRHGLLDGVVFSGGEATMQPALVNAAKQVKELGFQVGLHTAGPYPSRVEKMLNEGCLDWVGLDVKAMPKDYGLVTAPHAALKVEQTLKLLVDSQIDFEVRLTLWRGGLDYAVNVAKWCLDHGVKNFALQRLSDQNLPPEFIFDPQSWQWQKEQAQEALDALGFETAVVRM